MFHTIRANLGLLSDIDMLLFFEKCIRGGINGIGELRHFQANNKHMESFDNTKLSVYGAFYDVIPMPVQCSKHCSWTFMNGMKK